MSGTRRGRANGEGSIFPYKGRYAAYVWVTTPEGERKRAWVYGKDRDEAHRKWIKLHARASQGGLFSWRRRSEVQLQLKWLR